MNKDHADRGTVRRLAAALLGPILVGLVGCGGKGDVSGNVKYNGNPVPAGRVTFLSDAGEHRSYSALIKDGRYTVANFPAGPVKISVETFPPANPAANPRGAAGPPKDITAGFGPSKDSESYTSPPGQYVKLPPRFANTEQSGLTYTVTGGKQEHDVEMSGN